MTVALRRPMSVEEFLAWEERQELRYEFNGVRTIAMTGGTVAHDAIQINIVAALHARLRGKPCRVHGSSLKIRVMDSIRYPDAYVTCGPLGRPDATVMPDPVVIFEVLSKSTARTDRIDKNREYGSTASVRRYIMVEQTAVAGTMFVRVGDEWVGGLLGPASVLSMPEIDAELPFAEFYDGLDLTALPDEDDD